MRRIAILAEGAFEWHYGKTATGVIRYGKDTVVAVIDSTKAGKDVSQAHKHWEPHLVQVYLLYGTSTKH